jgi:hypothetical protein
LSKSTAVRPGGVDAPRRAIGSTCCRAEAQPCWDAWTFLYLRHMRGSERYTTDKAVFSSAVAVSPRIIITSHSHSSAYSCTRAGGRSSKSRESRKLRARKPTLPLCLIEAESLPSFGFPIRAHLDALLTQKNARVGSLPGRASLHKCPETCRQLATQNSWHFSILRPGFI